MSLPPRIHLIGVGGAGMSAIAKLLVGLDHQVTGSDLRGGTALDMLTDLGLDVWPGHRPERVAAADLVVASSAVPENDPELVAAAEAGVPVWRRPRLLDEMTELFPTIGPTGTHGKTTTTALLVTALRAAGVDPSFVVGGELVDLGTNAHLGADDLFVLEVDEAFGTFDQLSLQGLIVTNVEQDHMDHFGSSDHLEESFVTVMRRVKGPVVACLDDPGSARVAARTGAVTYGTHGDAKWRMVEFEAGNGGCAFRLLGPQTHLLVRLPRPGLHVARNAAGTLALLGELGYDLGPAAAGLAGFAGVRRRFEARGVVGGVRIVDDYAHHPTEVAATLTEAERFGGRDVWAVFQPHLYTRTRDLHREFGAALARADAVMVTDVYGSRETPIPGVTGRLVAASAQRAGARRVEYVEHRGDVAAALAGMVGAGDVVVTMGAGDITLVAGELAVALAARQESETG